MKFTSFPFRIVLYYSIIVEMKMNTYKNDVATYATKQIFLTFVSDFYAVLPDTMNVAVFKCAE